MPSFIESSIDLVIKWGGDFRCKHLFGTKISFVQRPATFLNHSEPQRGHVLTLRLLQAIAWI